MFDGKTIEELRGALQSYGRRRFPALREEIDDLASQALSDLWEYVACGQDEGKDALDLRKLAFAIFRRRAVDGFRRSARLWALSLDTLPEAELPAGAGVDPARSALYSRMLRICLVELADVAESDRALLSALDSGALAPGQPMAARERQRLHRLRVRLRDAIRRELGEDASQLLREDF
ncbi:hypothetical protein [Pseudoduganella namucuonensis]|uniref:RNA polymerase sigma-70 factor, ECF subfamily n=1 Tax=Pseudoduganella namucuonensis TaxID=1035707 RepID=A0A1I7M2Z2_9BURK|nr:hypothetical protein [Pseudoduganella namucuonensis]SFV16273.1 RNA polymerase sigma-70 factor, ECF subfamily [Pseudoduganella namucuonensis]